MLNLKKKSIDVLLKSALELNNIVNVYTDSTVIMNMTRANLIMTCYELLSYEYDINRLNRYVILDIKANLYLLEGKEVLFKWIEEIPDESYNLPNTIYKKITHNECYQIKNSIIYYNDTEVKLETLLQEKLDGFYEAIMETVNKDSIFAKLARIKEDLL